MTDHDDRPDASSADVHVLFNGYVDLTVSPFLVASTVSYVRDAEAQVVIDPGLVPSRRSILEPLEGLGVDPAEVTDVIFSHHHPDHTLNAALFPNARIHDTGPSTRTTPGLPAPRRASRSRRRSD